MEPEIITETEIEIEKDKPIEKDTKLEELLAINKQLKDEIFELTTRAVNTQVVKEPEVTFEQLELNSRKNKTTLFNEFKALSQDESKQLTCNFINEIASKDATNFQPELTVENYKYEIDGYASKFLENSDIIKQTKRSN